MKMRVSLMSQKYVRQDIEDKFIKTRRISIHTRTLSPQKCRFSSHIRDLKPKVRVIIYKKYKYRNIDCHQVTYIQVLNLKDRNEKPLLWASKAPWGKNQLYLSQKIFYKLLEREAITEKYADVEQYNGF